MKNFGDLSSFHASSASQLFSAGQNLKSTGPSALSPQQVFGMRYLNYQLGHEPQLGTLHYYLIFLWTQADRLILPLLIIELIYSFPEFISAEKPKSEAQLVTFATEGSSYCALYSSMPGYYQWICYNEKFYFLSYLFSSLIILVNIQYYTNYSKYYHIKSLLF